MRDKGASRSFSYEARGLVSAVLAQAIARINGRLADAMTGNQAFATNTVVDMIADYYGAEGRARLLAWLVLSEKASQVHAATQAARPLEPLVALAHAQRKKAQPGRHIDLADTRFLCELAAFTRLGEALFGNLVRFAFGDRSDAANLRDFSPPLCAPPRRRPARADFVAVRPYESLRRKMNALKDKVVLVTGSSRGIGAAIAKLFASEGARVAVHGRDEAMLSAMRQQIERAGGRAISVVADVTKFSEIERMRLRIEEEFDPIDVLIANAGGSHSPPGPIEDTTEEGWRASIDGNLTATFLTIKSVLPGMKKRRAGNIITMSSAAGRRPHPRSPVPYAAAKAGIELLTQDVAAQAGPFNIRANCIAPETILTEHNLERIPEKLRAELVEAHPLKRLGTPEDVARAALFLASDEATWITGVILDVAGGAVMVR